MFILSIINLFFIKLYEVKANQIYKFKSKLYLNYVNFFAHVCDEMTKYLKFQKKIVLSNYIHEVLYEIKDNYINKK